MPAGHPPGIGAGADASRPPCAANVDKSFSTFALPHEGHSTPLVSELRTSFSKLVPQSWQAYSKIGISGYSIRPVTILSMNPRATPEGPFA